MREAKKYFIVCLFSSRGGFTLLEMLAVIIIISVLASLVVPSVSGRVEKARRAAACADIRGSLAAALDLFEMDMGRFPSSQEGLSALVEAHACGPRWDGPYLRGERFPVDPWGNPYIYTSGGKKGRKGYRLYSAGPDGIPETEDDVE